MSAPAKTPPPPYHAVIFTSLQSGDTTGYSEMADRMTELAPKQPGFLGVESARGTDGLGITVSYWKDLGSIAAWKQNAEHLVAQKLGKERWYKEFSLRVCKVEKASEFRFTMD